MERRKKENYIFVVSIKFIVVLDYLYDLYNNNYIFIFKYKYK